MRTRRLIAALALMAFCAGCAGAVEFRLPKEFRDGKTVEDPPATWSPFVPDTLPC